MTEFVAIGVSVGASFGFEKELLGNAGAIRESAKSPFKGRNKGDARAWIDEMADNLVVCKMIERGMVTCAMR